MSWSYRNHIGAEYGIDLEHLSKCPTRVTRLTFDQWLTFYQGDPEHWEDFVESNNEAGWFKYHIPVYTKISMKTYPSGEISEKHECIYIKFLTRADFRKYKRYIKSILRNGEDFENQREIEELATYIGNIANDRLRETQRRTQQAIDENQRLMEETRLKIRAEAEGGRMVELSF